MRYVIIGGSAAGVAAAEAIVDLDPSADVVLLSEEGEPPYSRPLISYWLAEASYRTLLPIPSPVLSRVDLRQGARAVAVDPAARNLRLASGEELGYDRLLVATGAAPKALGLEGEEADNVFALRTVRDAEAIDDELRRGARRALVLGGGLVGIKAAQALNARGVETVLCVTSPHPLSQNVDPAAGRLVADALAREGIDVRLAHRPLGLERRDGRVAGVRFAGSHAAEPCDLVIRGKGVEPRSELLSGHGFPVREGVPTDDTLRTPLPDIWAAGDVARTRDLVTGAETVNAIWPAAVEQGRLAGRNMVLAGDGVAETCAGTLSMNSVHVGDRFVLSAGVTRPPDDTYEALSSTGPDGHYRSVTVRDGTVVGTVCVGDPHQAGVLIAAVRARTRLSDLPFHPLDPRLHWGRFAFAQG